MMKHCGDGLGGGGGYSRANNLHISTTTRTTGENAVHIVHILQSGLSCERVCSASQLFFASDPRRDAFAQEFHRGSRPSSRGSGYEHSPIYSQSDHYRASAYYGYYYNDPRYAHYYRQQREGARPPPPHPPIEKIFRQIFSMLAQINLEFICAVLLSAKIAGTSDIASLLPLEGNFQSSRSFVCTTVSGVVSPQNLKGLNGCVKVAFVLFQLRGEERPRPSSRSPT